MMAIQKLQSGPLHLLVAWSFTWAISHFCWWPMCKRWGQAFVKVKWWKLDYSDIQIICRKLATSTKWAYWFVSSSCTLTICFRCFFQVFFLFCHAFRFHLDKYSGGPTGTAWGMARTFQLEGIISWIRNFMGTPYVILAILPHPRCMLDPIFWCLSDSSALFTQQCATAEALRNLAEEWGSQTEKKRENIQGSRGHVFFPSSFLWTTFHIYIYKHVNVLSMHHTSLSLYVFIYI